METTYYLKFVFAFIFVIGLMLGLAWLLKYMGAAGEAIRNGKKHRRLRVSETLSLDSRRRLVLVRRDDKTEHLLLLGNNGDTVVETNIKPPKEPIDKNEKKETL